jgi:hypothetical protein
MAAVHSSNVAPLPHQLRAAYGVLLAEGHAPLRFLLADGPGAGKTIMAGLYLKELILRSACEWAIIVAPGRIVKQWRAELQEKSGLVFEVPGHGLTMRRLSRISSLACAGQKIYFRPSTLVPAPLLIVGRPQTAICVGQHKFTLRSGSSNEE